MSLNIRQNYVFFVSDVAFGGKHIYMANLVGALAALGARITLVVQTGGDLEKYLRAGNTSGVGVIDIDLFAEDSAVRETCKHLADVEPGSTVFATGRRDAQILHFTKPHMEHLHWAAFRHSGFPLAEGGPARDYYDSCSLLVLTSQRLLACDFAHVPADRKVLLRSTVPPNWATTVSQRRARRPQLSSGENPRMEVVYTGRLSWEKGIDRLLTAVSEQILTTDCLNLHLCGEGPDEAALRARVAELHLATRVTFHPFRRDVAEYYAMADCVVLPSVAGETGPLSLKEAMAAGIAVVASAVGGVGEFVEHGTSGLLVSIDEPLTGTLVQLAQDVSFRRQLAVGALKAAAAFGSWTDRATTLVAHTGGSL